MSGSSFWWKLVEIHGDYCVALEARVHVELEV